MSATDRLYHCILKIKKKNRQIHKICLLFLSFFLKGGIRFLNGHRHTCLNLL
jgi:hypothetical protein